MMQLGKFLIALSVAGTFSIANASSYLVLPSLYGNTLTGSSALVLGDGINPYWGAGTGFHYVQPRNGSGYWRSNPDGYCWNNKYGC